MPTDDGQHHSRVGRSSSQVERPRERQRRRVDPGARLVDGRGGLERQVAPVEAVDGGDDVHPLRDGPVRAGLELLRRCARGSHSRTSSAHREMCNSSRFNCALAAVVERPRSDRGQRYGRCAREPHNQQQPACRALGVTASLLIFFPSTATGRAAVLSRRYPDRPARRHIDNRLVEDSGHLPGTTHIPSEGPPACRRVHGRARASGGKNAGLSSVEAVVRSSACVAIIVLYTYSPRWTQRAMCS